MRGVVRSLMRSLMRGVVSSLVRSVVSSLMSMMGPLVMVIWPLLTRFDRIHVRRDPSVCRNPLVKSTIRSNLLMIRPIDWKLPLEMVELMMRVREMVMMMLSI